MKTKIGYKVLTSNRCSVVNIFTGGLVHIQPYAIQYFLGKWAIPKNPHMPLMVFNQRYLAEDFARSEGKWNNTTLDVYKVEYVESKKKWGWTTNADKILRKKRAKKKFSHHLEQLPEGTVLCDKVKLLHRI